MKNFFISLILTVTTSATFASSKGDLEYCEMVIETKRTCIEEAYQTKTIPKCTSWIPHFGCSRYENVEQTELVCKKYETQNVWKVKIGERFLGEYSSEANAKSRLDGLISRGICI